MESDNQLKTVLPRGLKVAAIYLIISGSISIIWPLLGFGPHHSEFETKSFAYKLGSYSRSFIFDLIFITAGIGILFRKAWARKTALIIIVISTIYTTNEFAWGMAKGKPGLTIYVVSLFFVGAWNAIWFYLIYRKKSAEALTIQSKEIV